MAANNSTSPGYPRRSLFSPGELFFSITLSSILSRKRARRQSSPLPFWERAITSDLVGVICQLSRMANSFIRERGASVFHTNPSQTAPPPAHCASRAKTPTVRRHCAPHRSCLVASRDVATSVQIAERDALKIFHRTQSAQLMIPAKRAGPAPCGFCRRCRWQ